MTADGEVRIANACTNPDLFWALKGGGGGFGVVTRVTLRTHALPEFFGGVFATVKATSDDAYRRLIARIVEFYAQALFNPHWGEQIGFGPGGVVAISMVFQGLDQQQAEAVWRPFFDWVAASPQDFAIVSAPRIVALPAQHFWDPALLKTAPGVVVADDRPGAPADNIFWAGNLEEAGRGLARLPIGLAARVAASRRIGAKASPTRLFAAAQHRGVALHFNKGLAGAAPEAIAAARDTAMNPAVADAFALAISGALGQPAYPGVPGHEPDAAAARSQARGRRTRRWTRSASCCRASAPMSGKPIFSSRTGRTPSGARITRGCARSRTNTIPTASSSSITALAAKTGARTGSRG